jgi:hypothetical protein
LLPRLGRSTHVVHWHIFGRTQPGKLR